MDLCLVGRHPIRSSGGHSNGPGLNAYFTFTCPRSPRLAPWSPHVYLLMNSFETDFLLQQLFPLFAHGIFFLRVGSGGVGKLIAPFVGTGGVDDRARAVAHFLARDRWVEGTAPAAPKDFDGPRRIRTAGDRPQNVLRVGNVDIVIDHDDVPPQIGARAA